MATFNPKVEISIKDLPEVQTALKEASDEIARLKEVEAKVWAKVWKG